MLYHVWFGTKRRKWLLLGEVEERVKSLLWQTAREKGIDLVECETVVNHVHLLLRSEPHSLPEAVHLLKGASARRLFQHFPELKMDMATNSFWQVRYGAKAVTDGAKQTLLHYIRTQKERLEKFEQQHNTPGLNLGYRENVGP